MKHDIFISYRRETGFEAARMIQERLKSSGYGVFLDFEELRSGNFNKQLYEKIGLCKDFILIVSPRCFDRCSDENDWLRLEIMHALKLGKNIIPVMLRNSGFPKPMPAGMEDLQNMQGVSANQEFFDASIKKLKKYLLAKPNLLKKHATPLLIVTIVLCVSALFYTLNLRTSDVDRIRTVSCSSEQGKMQQRFVFEQAGNLILLNEMVYEMYSETNESLKDHDTYLQLKQSPHPNSWSERLRYKLEKWERREFVHGEYKKLFSNEDLNVYVENYLSQDLEAIKETLKETYTTVNELYAEVNPALWLIHSKEHIALRKDIFNLQARDFLLIIMGTSEYLCEEAKATLEEILPELTEFGDDNKFITYEDAKRMSETNLARLEEKIRVMSTYIGDEQVKLRSMQIEYDQQDQLIEEREELLREKQSYVDKMESQVADVQKQIQIGHNTIKEQCKVLADDDAWLIWGKMIRLLYMNFKPEALENLTSFEEKMKEAGDDPSSYTIPTRRYIQEKYNIECQCGIVVSGFKDNLPHSCLQIGDIITKVDETAIVTVVDFSEARKEAGLEKAVMHLYRYDTNAQGFVKIECSSVVGDPLIGVMALTEDVEE